MAAPEAATARGQRRGCRARASPAVAAHHPITIRLNATRSASRHGSTFSNAAYTTPKPNAVIGRVAEKCAEYQGSDRFARTCAAYACFGPSSIGM